MRHGCRDIRSEEMMRALESIIKPLNPEILATCDGIDRIIRGNLATRKQAKLTDRSATVGGYACLQKRHR